MQEKIFNFWQQRQPRERMMLGWGSLIVVGILFYSLVWQPWHKALSSMQEVLPNKRADLVWMRQQAELITQGGTAPSANIKGKNQSLMAVIEQTAKASGVRDSIQQMVPRQNNQEVSVVLEETSFNNWLKWVDVLRKQYGVNIKQLSAERESQQPDTAEIRVTFERPQ